MNNLWTEREIELLRRHYKKGSKHTQKILAKHGYTRTLKSIVCKSSDLGVNGLTREWLTTEVAILRKFYPMGSAKLAQKQLELHGYSRSIGYIYRKARMLNIKYIQNRRKWSDKEIAFVIENNGKIKRSEIAKALDRTLDSVSSFIKVYINNGHKRTTTV